MRVPARIIDTRTYMDTDTRHVFIQRVEYRKLQFVPYLSH